MSDTSTLLHLARIMQQRPAGHIVGMREGVPVRKEQFLQRVAAWRTLLQNTAGKNFALYLTDSIEFGAALLGIWQAGKTAWLPADTLHANNTALAATVDGFLGEFPAEFSPIQADADVSNDVSLNTPLAADFIGLIVYTSGTTGAAQAIPKRLVQLSSEVATLESLFGATLGDAELIATVSHQHIYGLLFKVLWPLTAGRVIHAHSMNFPEQLAEALAAKPCALIASPAHLKRLPDHLDWRAAAERLRIVFSSGGPLPADVAQRTGQLLGKVPVEIYGSSETGGVAWRQRLENTGESWQALPHVTWRVAAQDDLLEVCSPHSGAGEWLRTADRVQQQADGRFLLRGRTDRIVKIEEKRISLDAIEAALAASPLVAAVRVLVCDDEVGQPHQRQRLAAFVVLAEQGQHLLQQEGKTRLNRRLRDVLSGVIDTVGLPRRWRYLDQMPVDAQGKTSRASLLALLESRPREPVWQLIERNAEQVKLEVRIPADLLYFDGHFDQVPILPGVVQVDWAIKIGREYFSLPLRFLGIAALKFQHVIQPESVVTLELSHDVKKNSLQFRYVSARGQHASGRVLFGDAPAQA